MGTIEAARRVLGEAEASLRGLMEQGLRAQRYGDLAEVARLADGLARLVNGHAGASAAGSNGAAAAWRASAVNGDGFGAAPPGSKGSTVARAGAETSLPRVSAERGRRSKKEYPRFEREGDRLVKIAWSKKQRGEYEHRAPWAAVQAFVRHLGQHVREGKVFKVEDLLPVPDPATGADVPSYQVYLTLAWLRMAGAVQKKGRDGWVLRKGGLGEGKVEELWAGVVGR